ncbi:FkbM family methyltransferase [Salinibacter ruber]|uniref:FkbM family methyltransferase n=1 Tax=Salinibacter ruber TaxID=146919 RepID=UPI002168C12F|nr:FkbM family methyltransferase [Salinibacter ruber]
MVLKPVRGIRSRVSEQTFQIRYGEHDIYKVSIHGEEIHFSTQDRFSKGWFFPRYKDKIHEPKTTALIARLSQVDGEVIDIGANLGWFSCISASISRETVHAVELDEDNVTRLQKNTSLNQFGNIQVSHLAITESLGSVSYWKEPGSADAMHTLSRRETKEREKVSVETMSLDRFVEKNCQSVGLLKIDVEGAEKKVLKGGQETLHELHPHILLEVHPPQLKSLATSVHEVLALLPDTYKLFRVSDFRDSPESSKKEFTSGVINRHEFDTTVNSMLYAEPPGISLNDIPPLRETPYRVK